MSDAILNLPSIVIVDDDTDQLFLTRRLLEKTEVKNPIIEIGGGPEAIRYLTACCSANGSAESKLPVLVFLDLKMPTIDGFGVLSWIRNNPALHDMKVIILTSSDDLDDVKRCTRLGAQGFLVKHPNPMVISCVMRQALGEKTLAAVAQQ
jgi:CheY-like chemotaxis protein